MTQTRAVSGPWSAQRYHCRGDVKQVVEGIDEDETVHRVPEVGKGAKGADDCSYTNEGEPRSGTLHDLQRAELVSREGHGELRFLYGGESFYAGQLTAELYASNTIGTDERLGQAGRGAAPWEFMIEESSYDATTTSPIAPLMWNMTCSHALRLLAVCPPVVAKGLRGWNCFFERRDWLSRIGNALATPMHEKRVMLLTKSSPETPAKITAAIMPRLPFAFVVHLDCSKKITTLQRQSSSTRKK